MKKWKRNYIIAIVIIIVLIFIISASFVYSNRYTYNELLDFIKYPMIVASLVVVFAVLGYWCIEVFITMKNGTHNLMSCDDKLFENIDKYKKGFGESCERYKKQIQIINFYYQEGGKVDKLVKKKEFDRLYARADYLYVQNTLYSNLMTYVYSLIISVLASFICAMTEVNNVIYILIGLVVIVISFFVIILSGYAERGQAGSYRYMIDEYERELLLEKIRKLEKSIIMTQEDEDCLETKQTVINELIKIRDKSKCKKNKTKINNDIECIERLDLCLGDYTKCHKQKIYVNGKQCYLIYDIERRKKKNYIDEYNLKTRDYSILYHILKKYNLISYNNK